MKKKRHFFKMVGFCSLTFILGVMVIVVVLFFLVTYLLHIQMPERLKYVKDYSDFTLEIAPISNCVDEYQLLFQHDGVIYSGICVADVLIQYGKTKAPLSYVLEQNYITLKELKRKFQKIKEKDETVYYEYRRSDEENGNYRVTISPKVFQQAVFQEVTFEPFFEN